MRFNKDLVWLAKILDIDVKAFATNTQLAGGIYGKVTGYNHVRRVLKEMTKDNGRSLTDEELDSILSFATAPPRSPANAPGQRHSKGTEETVPRINEG